MALMSAARQHQQAQHQQHQRQHQHQQQQLGQHAGQGQDLNMDTDQQLGLYRYKVATLSQVERGLHWVEVLGCVTTTITAVRSHEPILALWSLSALATSLASLALMCWRPALLASPSFREPWYAGVRLHRALAVAGMRRILKDPVNLGSRGYLAKALLVNSSVLPILLQALILQLSPGLGAATQVLAAAVAVASMPEYCAQLAADGVPQRDWERLAMGFAWLSDMVMSASALRRTDYEPSEIPCSVSLSYLIVVCEVLLPVLFLHYWDRALRRWYAAKQEQQAAAGTAGSGPGGAGAGLQGAGGGASHTVASPRHHGGGHHQQVQQPAQQAQQQQQEQARRWQQAGAYLRDNSWHMSPGAMVVLCLGVCGVLWDVAVTIYLRWLR